ncbi:hypothetical protein [Amaricoccus sp.]|uniref:hypothetical protein n=1 Tax=Amaricoccus sp. TaxID=1872485 RepID=UPI001B57F2FC|nr:hypothetical protein [Amaricoccus sp.]MBP7003138.1 hypothetical protein [Amaricoccus sp.]
MLALGIGSAAAAATIDVSYFGRGQAAEAKAALDAFQAGTDGTIGPKRQLKSATIENFKGFAAWNGAAGAADPTTSVGAFAALGGHGKGGTAVNGGTALQVRNYFPENWGRFDVGAADGNWLDSNDTLGMRWDVATGGKFNALAFLLTDVADVGAKFTIKVGDTLYSQVIGAGGKLANGSIHFVRILLPETIENLVVELRNDRLNDGFGIAGATVQHIAPVPLPPAVLLLASGAVALFGVSRRRRAAA